jgi:hypothetical protein
MKIQDDARWLAQRAELGQKIGPQSAQAFIGFVEEWCDRAETWQELSYWEGREERAPHPIESLRLALEPTEASNGYLDTNTLANMLVVICANWEYGGDEFFESMTEFEKRIVVDVAGQMIAEQQDAAAGESVPDEDARLVYGQQVPTDG